MHERADFSDALAVEARGRRKALSLRQDEVADLAGCSTRFVHMLETAKPSLRLDKVLDVLDVLGLGLLVAQNRPAGPGEVRG